MREIAENDKVETMNEELKNRLRFWKEKADHVSNDHWVRFIIYWMMFDASITEGSGKDNDRARLNWFYANDNELKNIFREYWNRPKYLEILGELKKLSPISDMRPSKRENSSVVLSDILNEQEVLEFIYQIRCNTFHGAKDLSDTKDQHLVRLTGELFDQPLSAFVGLI